MIFQLNKNKLYISTRKFFFKIVNVLQNMRALFIKYKTPNSLVLMYHRIDNIVEDPVLLNVNPENFRKQISWLKENMEIVSLKEISTRLKNRELLGNEVAITFDDGYFDIYKNAVPILKELKAPATFFITTQNLDKHPQYDWDIVYNKSEYINKEKLREISECDLFEIGAHTKTHKKLSRLNYTEQAEEIVGSKIELENILGREIDSFAYPFGGRFDFNKNSIKIVSENFKLGCAGFAEAITKKTSIFKIPRIVIRDENIEDFKKRLSTYTTIQ